MILIDEIIEMIYILINVALNKYIEINLFLQHIPLLYILIEKFVIINLIKQIKNKFKIKLKKKCL